MDEPDWGQFFDPATGLVRLDREQIVVLGPDDRLRLGCGGSQQRVYIYREWAGHWGAETEWSYSGLPPYVPLDRVDDLIAALQAVEAHQQGAR